MFKRLGFPIATLLIFSGALFAQSNNPLSSEITHSFDSVKKNLHAAAAGPEVEAVDCASGAHRSISASGIAGTRLGFGAERRERQLGRLIFVSGEPVALVGYRRRPAANLKGEFANLVIQVAQFGERPRSARKRGCEFKKATRLSLTANTQIRKATQQLPRATTQFAEATTQSRKAPQRFPRATTQIAEAT